MNARPMPCRRGLLLAALLLPLATCAAATDEIVVNGEVRYRGLLDGTDFDGDTDPRQYSELRTRIGLAASPQDGLDLFVQLQDSRVLGENSGGLTADANVGLHQGWLRYDLGRGTSLQAGRFELAFGDQRLVGTVGWNNVGRTWDGVRLIREGRAYRADLFLVNRNETAREVDAASGRPLFTEDEDHDFAGLNVRFTERKLELFLYADRDRTPRLLDAEAGVYEDERDDLRLTLGAHAAREFGGGFDYAANLAYQFGTRKVRVAAGDERSEGDIGAYLISLESGYTFEDDAHPRVALLLDYASGDDDGDDLRTFDDLYYTGHKWRGYMDYFVASNPLGLLDLALRIGSDLSPRWRLHVDLHHFQAAEEYVAGDGGGAHDVGQELDVTLVYRDDAFTVQLGASGFDADAEAYNYDGRLGGIDDAYWAYGMLTARF